MSKLLLAVAIAIVAVAGPAAGDAFGATTRIVDDDGRASPPANCGATTSTFNMIEPAVEASSPGDTVNVCPGTYPEQVSVEADENGLTLHSLVFRAAVIKAPPVMTDPGDIVTINGAQNVTLRDFTVAGPLPDALFCSLFHRTGVRVIGGGSAIIRGNHVTEIRSTSPALRGCINGFAIAVGRQSEGQTGRATIFDNQLDLYQKGGILVDNAGSTAEIRTNLVQGEGPTPPPNTAQNGIQISRGAVATVADNDVQDHTYSLAPLTGGTGIFLSQAGATTTVSDNQAVRNDWNIFVGTTTGAQILRNVLLDATFFDGIRMSATTSNNRIEDNFLRNNREHDCHDDSVGPNNPPALVANLWINNDGVTENRPGLCDEGIPARLTLSPKTATNPVGTQHCVTATVTDLVGNPISGIIVRFSVTGSVTTSGPRSTNASGQATFCYTGPPFPGADAIHAYADTNNSDDQDVGEPFDDATKTWVLPVSTPGCEVKITNGGWIIAANGDKSSFGGNAKVDADGNVSGNEEYQDHGPAQPMNLKGNVLVVICTSATQATIYGQATIDGSGSFFYRLNVEDNGEPGKADKYWMFVDNGYDSGNQTLRGGNIQIHKS